MHSEALNGLLLLKYEYDLVLSANLVAGDPGNNSRTDNTQ